MGKKSGSATGVRSPVFALRGRCPGPLDDGAMFASLPETTGETNPGSSRRSSSSQGSNESENRSTGNKTTLLRRKVLSPELKLKARSHHRQQLIAAEKARLGSDRLSDADYERISNWMQAWEARRCW